MDCKQTHTQIKEVKEIYDYDKKSTLTTKNNFEQNCVNATENRRIGERERRTTTFAKGFCGGCER